MQRFATVAALVMTLGLTALWTLSCSAPSPAPTLRGEAPPAIGTSGPAAGGVPATTQPSGPRAATAPNTLVVGVSFFPLTLDPQNVVTTGRGLPEPFNEGLIRVRRDRVEPALAASWRQVDPSRMEFQLRPNVRFSDGSPLTADDVIFSLDRFRSLFNTSLSQIDSWEKTGPMTVLVKSKAPDPVIQQRLTPLFIVSKSAVEKATPEQINNQPVGTGPYRIQAYDPKVRLTLAPRTDGPWRPAGPVQIQFAALPESASRVAALRSGQVDMIDSVAPDQADALKNDGFVVTNVLKASTHNLFLNPVPADSPFRDRRLREAVDLAIDREALVKNVFAGYYAVAPGQSIPAGIPGNVPSARATPQNLERARQLLAEAGLANGFTLPLRYTESQSSWRPTVEAVSGFLRRVGINAQIESVDQAIWLQRSLRNENGPLVMTLSAFSTPDGDGTLSFFLSTANSANLRGFASPEFDRLLLASRLETDPSKRAAMMAEAANLVVQEKLYAYLYQVAELYGSYPGVKGVEAGLSDGVAYEFVTK